jgi:hypothetical protein
VTRVLRTRGRRTTRADGAGRAHACRRVVRPTPRSSPRAARPPPSSPPCPPARRRRPRPPPPRPPPPRAPRRPAAPRRGPDARRRPALPRPDRPAPGGRRPRRGFGRGAGRGPDDRRDRPPRRDHGRDPCGAGRPAGRARGAVALPAPGDVQPRAMRGSVALGDLLRSTYPGTSYGVARACGSDASEHYEGRAVDWMVSHRNPVQLAQAQAFLGWLLAPDASGRAHANARRLGILYVIWNDKIWGAYRSSEGWRPYSTCATRPQPASDTACHRDHVHISLSWAGAAGRTSFWTGRVAATDYGPCRPGRPQLGRRLHGPAPDAVPGAPQGGRAARRVLGRRRPLPGLRRPAGPRGERSAGERVAARAGAAADGSFGPVTAPPWRRCGCGTGCARRRSWTPPRGAPCCGRSGPARARSGPPPVADPGTPSRHPSRRPSRPGPSRRTLRLVLSYGDSGSRCGRRAAAARRDPTGWFGPRTRAAVRPSRPRAASRPPARWGP